MPPARTARLLSRRTAPAGHCPGSFAAALGPHPALAVQVLADTMGTLVGSITIDGHPQLSEDGSSFVDDGSLVTVTMRDAAGDVATVVRPGTPGRPVTPVKIRVGVPGFPGEVNATPIPYS